MWVWWFWLHHGNWCHCGCGFALAKIRRTKRCRDWTLPLEFMKPKKYHWNERPILRWEGIGFNFSNGVQFRRTLRNGECWNPKQVGEPCMQLKGDDSPHNKVHMMAKSQGCMLCVNPWTYLRVGYHGQLSSHVKRFIPFIRSTVGNSQFCVAMNGM